MQHSLDKTQMERNQLSIISDVIKSVFEIFDGLFIAACRFSGIDEESLPQFT